MLGARSLAFPKIFRLESDGYIVRRIREHNLFFFAWGLWIIILVIKDTYGFPHDSLSATVKLATHAPFLFLIAYEISWSEHYGYKDALFILVVVLALASSTISSDMLFLKMILFIYCGRRIDIKTLLLFTAALVTIACIGVILAAILGFIEMHIVDRGGVRERNCLGFEWANRPIDYLLAIALMYIAARGGRAKLIILFICALIATWLFLITGARTPFALLLAVIGAVLLMRIFDFTISSQLMRLVLVSLFMAAPLTVIVLSVTFDPSIPWMNDLNNALSNRLLQSNRSLTIRSISLLGTPQIVSDSSFRVYMDSAFLQLLSNYGVIILVLTIGLMAIGLERMCSANNRYMALCLLCFAFWGMFEEAFAHLQLDPFLFLIGSVVYSEIVKRRSARKLVLVH